jgi:hypothetical protein
MRVSFKRSRALLRLAPKVSSALERPVRSQGNIMFGTRDENTPQFPNPDPQPRISRYAIPVINLGRGYEIRKLRCRNTGWTAMNANVV